MRTQKTLTILLLAHALGSLTAVVATEVHSLNPVTRNPYLSEYLAYLYASLGTVPVGALYVRNKSPCCLIATSTVLPAATLWTLHAFISTRNCFGGVNYFCSLYYIAFGSISPFVLFYGPLAMAASGLIAYAAIRFATPPSAGFPSNEL
jgi:hypothetical protein